MSNDKHQDRASTFVGLASIALCLVGLGMAFLAFQSINQVDEDYVGAGVCGIASALSFGMLLNAYLRS